MIPIPEKITLATLPVFIDVEIFGYVTKKLLEQKAVSAQRGVCVYRHQVSSNTCHKCAGGMLIGDDEYVSEMEEKSWPVLVKAGLAPNVHVNLIYDLQNMHDNLPADLWKEHFRKYCIKMFGDPDTLFEHLK